jgi:hypothetical protein
LSRRGKAACRSQPRAASRNTEPPPRRKNQRPGSPRRWEPHRGDPQVCAMGHNGFDAMTGPPDTGQERGGSPLWETHPSRRELTGPPSTSCSVQYAGGSDRHSACTESTYPDASSSCVDGTTRETSSFDSWHPSRPGRR